MNQTFTCSYEKALIYIREKMDTNYTNCLRSIDPCNKDLKISYDIIIDEIFDNSYKDIRLCDDIHEYRIDIILKPKKFVKIYGIVKNLDGKLVEGVIVNLFRENHRGYIVDTIEDGYAITDITGMFMFIRQNIEPGVMYKATLAS